MATIKDGGPAFPVVETDNSDRIRCGMTLRDYFAAAALSGFLAGDAEGVVRPENAAKFAYDTADAMIAARTQTT